MKKFIVIYSDRDQEDGELHGFSVLTETEVDKLEELLSEITWVFEYDNGDGMVLEFANGEELLSRLEFKEISEDEAKGFERLFNSNFGTFVDINYLTSITDEGEEDWGEDEEDEDY